MTEPWIERREQIYKPPDRRAPRVICHSSIRLGSQDPRWINATRAFIYYCYRTVTFEPILQQRVEQSRWWLNIDQSGAGRSAGSAVRAEIEEYRKSRSDVQGSGCQITLCDWYRREAQTQRIAREGSAKGRGARDSDPGGTKCSNSSCRGDPTDYRRRTRGR